MFPIDELIKDDVIKNYGSEVKLPIVFPPPIYYSLFAADKLAIILNNKSAINWLYNNFIQLVFYVDNLKVKVPNTHYLSVWPIDLMKIDQRGANFFLREHVINNNVMELNRNNLVGYLRRWLDNGLYIIANVDSTKISKSRYYGKKAFCHSAFIFGYNEKGTYQVEFLKSGKLDIVNVPYDEVAEAIFSQDLPQIFRENKNMDVDYNLTLVELRKNIHCEINTGVIKSWIIEYLNSTDIQIHNNFFVQSENTVSGIKVYQCVIEMAKIMDENKRLDYRMFHALYEHKVLMLSRVKALINQELISNDISLIIMAEELVKISEVCRMVALKYNFVPGKDKIVKLENRLLELKEKEIVFLQKFLKAL